MAEAAKKPWEKPTPDQTVLKGGPGEEPAAKPKDEPPAPKVVEVNYGGKKFSLPEDLALAWQDREKEFGQKLSQHSEELGSLRKTAQEYEAVKARFVQPTETRPDPATLMFENPRQFVQNFKQEITQELRGEWQRQQADEQAWQGFRSKHDDLSDERDLVTFMATQHAQELTSLPPSQRMDRLADLTRERIVRIHSKFKKSNGSDTDLTDGNPFVEAPGRRAPKPSAKEPEPPATLSEVISAGRKRRLYPNKGG